MAAITFKMEKLTGIDTKIGKIKGRDAIFLDKILFNSETDLTITGNFSQKFKLGDRISIKKQFSNQARGYHFNTGDLET